jgi:hypothetical protein
LQNLQDVFFLQTNGSGVLSFAGVSASAGQVIQVKTATDNTVRSTTSSSFVTASNTLSVTITPSSSSNKILLLVSTCLYIDVYSIVLTIFKNGSNLTNDNGFANIDGFGAGADTVASISYLDSPATTSAITYDVRFKVNASTGNLNDGSVLSSITALEIKG